MTSDEGGMLEEREFERQVRDALRAEAEAGPDYATTLHARVMERVWAAVQSPATAPAPVAKPEAPRMAMMVLGAAIIVLALLTIFVIARGH